MSGFPGLKKRIKMLTKSTRGKWYFIYFNWKCYFLSYFSFNYQCLWDQWTKTRVWQFADYVWLYEKITKECSAKPRLLTWILTCNKQISQCKSLTNNDYCVWNVCNLNVVSIFKSKCSGSAIRAFLFMFQCKQ